MLDGKAFGAEIVEVVQSYVTRQVAPLLERNAALEARLAVLEARELPSVKDGRDGADGLNGVGVAKAAVSEAGILFFTLSDGTEIEAGNVKGADGRDGQDGEPGKDGQPGEAGKDGADGRDGIDGQNGQDGEPGKDGADGNPGERGQDGKDADPEEIAAAVASEVSKAVAGLPVPQNGKDGRDGIDGKDGVGLASALIGRNGELIVTLTNGDTKDLGLVIGKDGAAGLDGSDGKDGAPGTDGLGFDDMTETVEDDGRTIVRRYQRGDEVKEFRHTLAVPIDRGVYKDGQAYKAGDGVTLGGSWWLARKDTEARPDGGSEDWRLAVKRGRDGKDGKDGERGLQGKAGEAGKDLTQLGPNGQKW